MTPELQFAINTLRSAGEVLKDYHGKNLEIEPKNREGTDWGTKADLASNDLILSAIKKAYPDHAIYTEEEGSIETESEYKWIVDPFDGTIPGTFPGLTNRFSCQMGLTKNGLPLLGASYLPIVDEMYYAEIGGGTFLNDEPIQVGDESNFGSIRIGWDVGKAPGRAEGLELLKMLYDDKQGINYHVSTACSSALLSFVAKGHPLVNAYMSHNLAPEDMAPWVPIIIEAGGKATSIKGEQWKFGEKSLLASNPKIHKQILDQIN